MNIDIHNFERQLKRHIEIIETSPILPHNKELLFQFKADCMTGWGGQKLSKARTVKYLSSVRNLMEMVPELDWMMITKKDVKNILVKIDEDPKKGAWSQADYRVALRKFVSWMRTEYNYPQNYPERERVISTYSLLEYPEEVSGIKLKIPGKLPAPEDIPTDKEMQYICEAATHPRDRAFLEVAKELGPRVGGLGSRQLKHITFDHLGARVTVSDKTMSNDPVRLVASASYLRLWIDAHPFKDNPEAPVWLDMHKVKKGLAVHMNYCAIRALIIRMVRRHNETAESKNLPKITKRIYSHLFRYHAQTRDEGEGVPRSVMCKQRGWKADSKQPDRYARVSTKRVDDYYAERYGISEEQKDVKNEPKRCQRCHEINPPASVYCYKCGMPLSKEVEEVEAKVLELVDRLLREPDMLDKLSKI